LGGTGLGLSIVKHLLQAHGGSLSIDSAPGLGTTVSLAFPRFEETQ
jgi:signal transduction histidine kinase